MSSLGLFVIIDAIGDGGELSSRTVRDLGIRKQLLREIPWLYFDQRLESWERLPISSHVAIPKPLPSGPTSSSVHVSMWGELNSCFSCSGKALLSH
jgi:hypothetical protein